MTAPFLSPEIPDELVDLGVMLGVLTPANGQPASINPAWFTAPDQHIKGILDDSDRRQALIDLATELLGTATEHLDLPDIDEEAETWIPIVDAGAGVTTGGLFVIIDTGAPEPVVSLGGRVAVQHDTLTGSMTIRVPLISAGAAGMTLLPGRPEGVIEVAVNVTVDGLGVAGIVELEGVSFAALLPTDAATDPSLTVVLQGLQLPGDTSPSDILVGELLDELGPTAIQVMLGLVRSQSSLPTELEDLLALIGFDPASPIPELPLVELIDNGIPALREWVTEVVATALDEWMGRLASFLGIGAVAGAGTLTDPYRICIDDDPVHACLTLSTLVDSQTGATTVIPGASVTVDAPAGSSVGGAVEGTLEFARLILDQGLSVASGPALTVTVRLGDGSLVDTTTVDDFSVEVGALRAGLSFRSGGQLTPVVEAVDTKIDGNVYPLLDLTSAEAVTGAASDALDNILDDLLDALGISTNPGARALAVLAGLIAPDGAPAGWPDPVSLPSLFSDPLHAIGCYHASVLTTPGRWQHVADHLALLLRSDGTPAVTGTGTTADPWVATLFDNRPGSDPVRGAVNLVAWSTIPDTAPVLHLGLETHPVFDVAGLDADLAYRAEVVRLELPVPPDCQGTVGLTWAPAHRAVLTVTQPDIELGQVTFTADRLVVGFTFDSATGMVPELAVTGPELTIEGSDFSLPDLDLGSLPDLDDLPWSALQLLAGDWLGNLGLGRLDEWLALLGWQPGDPPPFTLPRLPDVNLDLPDLPALDLEGLLTDPLSALVEWLSSLFGGSGSSLELPPFLLAIGRFATAVGGAIQDVTGSGTYHEPWAVRIGDGPVEVLVWLDPDGPDLAGASGIVEHLLGDTAPTLEEALELLDRAGRFIPELGEALGGIGSLGPGIEALRARLEGDGLVAAADQHPAGWERVDLSPAAHFSEPAGFTMPSGTGGIQKQRRIFVTSAGLAGVADWPDHDTATIVDLTEPGIRPGSIDLSHITSGDTWIVLLPSRAEAVVPDEPAVPGEERLRARLRRAVDHIHGIVGGSLALIGHSTAGQITRLVAADPLTETHIRHVITVGTPHGGASFEFLDRLDTGETLRTLQRLRGMLDDDASAPDVAPFVGLLDSLSSTLDPYLPGPGGVLEFVPFPVADFGMPAVYPDVGAGTTGHAVVGSVAGSDLDAALAAFIRRVIEAGIGLLPAGSAVTHVGFGLRAALAEPDRSPGVVSVGATARLDLHRVRLAAGTSERTIPLVSAGLELRRNGGWLVGGPDPAHPAGLPRDPRARWLEASLVANPSAPADSRLSITIHDASLFGTARPQWFIDDEQSLDGVTLIPEARILLGEALSGVGTLVAGSPAERLADVLTQMGLAEIIDGRPGLVTDAVERLLTDPAGEISTRFSTHAAQVESALARFVPVTYTDMDITLALAPWATLHIPRTGSPVTLEVSEFAVADLLEVSGRLFLDDDGEAAADLDVSAIEPPGPLGSLALGVTASADEGVAVELTGVNTGQLPTLVDAPVPILPTHSDLTDLAGLAGRALAGDLARRVLVFARDQLASARGAALEAALATVGAVTSDGRVRNLAGLLTSPGDWLAGPGALGLADSLPGTVAGVAKLSATEVRALVLSLRDVLDLPDAGPTLPLPWGASLSVDGTAGDVTLSLGWDAPMGGADVDLDGGLALTVSPGLDVRATVSTSINVTGTGLDHARLELSAADDVTLSVAIQPQGGTETVINLLPTVSGLSGLAANPTTIRSVLALALGAVANQPDVGPALSDLGDHLGLRDATGFLADQLRQVAANPAAELVARLHAAAVAVMGDLAALVGEVADGVTVSGTRLTVSPATGVSLILDVPDLATISLCVDVVDQRPVPELRLDVSMCIDHTGLESLAVTAEVTDPALLEAAGVPLLPRVAFLAGTAAGPGGDRAEAGLWVESPGADPRHGLFVLMPFGSEPSPVCRTGTGTATADSTDLSHCLAVVVRHWVTPLAAELVLAVEDVAGFLEQTLTHVTATLGDLLETADILTHDSDWHLADGVVDDLLGRVLALAAGILDEMTPIPLGPLELAPVVDPDGGRTSFGLEVRLGTDLVLNPGSDIQVSVTEPAGAGGGIGLVVFTAAADLSDPRFHPSLTITDVGIEIASASGGKLVDLVAGVDAIELLAGLTIDEAGVQSGGLEVGFVNLTLPIGVAGGGNPVASKILSAQNEDSASGDPEELAPALNPRLELTLAPDFALEFRLDVGEGPWWIPIQQAFGPIYVEQVGGQVENDTAGDLEAIVLLLDGGVSLAGLTVGVDDLSLRIPWETGWDITQWAIDLQGLAIGYSGSGVSLAGGLRKSITPAGDTEYVGLVQVDARGFGVSAVGAYGEFADPAQPGTTYTSMFVFAALSAPLGGPPFFFVTGIGGGIGLNRELVLPADVVDIPGFPLVAAMDSSSGFAADPMGVLDTVSNSFPGRRGTFWFAAGVRFTSFVLLETVAVLAVEIGDDVEVALVGLSRAALPDPEFPIANIELALIARFSTAEGVLWVQGQLTDNSWLLNEDCRLTGGFAFVVWFARDEFVFTIGGFHPRFAAPDYYPVVPRLGFNWNVSSALVIKGENYFALTSSCVMAGAKIEASYTTSTVWASLSAGIDGLVSWDPFFYDVEVYVRVSAGIKIRVCFFACATIKMSFSIGARLRIWGPELKGEATLELGPVEVTVRFGANPKDDDRAIPWSQFVAKYLVQENPAGESMSMTVMKGLLAPDPGLKSDTDDGSAAKPWRVVPEFTLRFETRAASNEVSFPGGDTSFSVPIDLAPVGVTSVDSTFRVTIRETGGAEIDEGLELEARVVSKLPDGPWRYVARESRGPEAGTIDALTGVVVRAQLTIADDDILVDLSLVDPGDLDHPLPFHEEQADRPTLMVHVEKSEDFILAQPTATNAVLAKASTAIDGLAPASIRTFRADRVSPPRLAPLTEGMVDPVKPAVATEPVAPPEPPSGPDTSTQPPVVMGVLRDRLGVEARAPAATTVKAAGDVARVAAPTLTDVRLPGGAFPRAHLRRGSEALTTRRGTAFPRLHMPSTGTAVRGREFRAGFRATPANARSLTTIQRRVRNGGHDLAPGDVLLLKLPNARWDDQPERPRLAVAGDQATRVVVLDRAGAPISDEAMREGTVDLPVGAERVAVAGLGDTSRFGLAGWHAEMSVQQVSSNTYLASRALIRSAAPRTRRRGSPVSIANLTAREATLGRSVVTHLPAATTAILVGLSPTEPVADPTQALASIRLGLLGADRAARPDGTRVEPRVVVSGDQMYGAFAVEPNEDGGPWVTVSIESDPRWNVIAVGATSGRFQSLIEDLIRGDPAGLFGSGADPTGSSRVRFVPASSAIPSPERQPA